MPTIQFTLKRTNDARGGWKLRGLVVDDYTPPTYKTCCQRTISDIENSTSGYQWNGTTPWPSAYASDVVVMMDAAFTALGSALAAHEVGGWCDDGGCYSEIVTAESEATIGDYSFADPSWTGGPASVSLTLVFSNGVECGVDGDYLEIAIDMPSPTPPVATERLPVSLDGDGYYVIGDGANWWGNEFARFKFKLNITDDCTQTLVDPGTPHSRCFYDYTHTNRRQFQRLCGTNDFQLEVDAETGFQHPPGRFPPCRRSVKPDMPDA